MRTPAIRFPLPTAGACLLLALGACSSYPPGTGETSPCGDGARVASDGHEFCAYGSSAVTGGFACPAVVPNRYDGEGWVVCADVQGLGSEDVAAVAKQAGVVEGSCADSSQCQAGVCEECVENVCTRVCPGLCSSDGVCGGGRGEDNGYGGNGHLECADVSDCYPLGYCNHGACWSIQPESGNSANDCARARLAPPQDPGGPVIWAPGQDVVGTGGSACTKDPQYCQNNGDVCQFSFQAFDPEDDLVRERPESYTAIHLVAEDGTLQWMYDVPRFSGSTVRVLVCVPEAERHPVVAAVVLDDAAGHHSNPLCLVGTAP